MTECFALVMGNVGFECVKWGKGWGVCGVEGGGVKNYSRFLLSVAIFF